MLTEITVILNKPSINHFICGLLSAKSTAKVYWFCFCKLRDFSVKIGCLMRSIIVCFQ